jgi:hypothetical protein
MAETQPKLQPALLRLSAIVSQYLMRADSASFCSTHGNDKVIESPKADAIEHPHLRSPETHPYSYLARNLVRISAMRCG